MAPVSGLLWKELLSGRKTWTGEEVTARHVVEQLMIPMYIEDIADAYEDGGLARAVAAGVPAFYGVGVQTWNPRKKKRKRVTY